jgi:hypothetical protein
VQCLVSMPLSINKLVRRGYSHKRPPDVELCNVISCMKHCSYESMSWRFGIWRCTPSGESNGFRKARPPLVNLVKQFRNQSSRWERLRFCYIRSSAFYFIYTTLLTVKEDSISYASQDNTMSNLSQKVEMEERAVIVLN